MSILRIKGEAVLREWRFGKSVEGSTIVFGAVYGHPKFKDGTRVHTSAVLHYNHREDVIETLHTFYKLED